MARLALYFTFLLSIAMVTGASAQIGPPGRPQLATEGAPPPPPPPAAPPEADPFSGTVDTPCISTPDAQTVAWVDDDNSSGSRDGSRGNPFVCRDLSGENRAVDLFARGFRDVCVVKASTNYAGCFHTNDISRVFNQKGTAAEQLEFWAHPMTVNSAGSNQAYSEVPVLNTLIGADQGRYIPEYLSFRGFIFGDHTTEAGLKAKFLAEPFANRWIVEYNHFRGSSAFTGSGNDASVRTDNTDGTIVRFNHFGTPQPGLTSFAAVRDFNAINIDVSNNDFYFCQNVAAPVADAIYMKQNEQNWSIRNNRHWIRDDCASSDGEYHPGFLISGTQSGTKDSNNMTIDRNQVFCQRGFEGTNNCLRGFLDMNGSNDNMNVSWNLLSGAQLTFTVDGSACNGSLNDLKASTPTIARGNVFMNDGTSMRFDKYSVNNPQLTELNNFFNVPGRHRFEFTIDQHGHNAACGGGQEIFHKTMASLHGTAYSTSSGARADTNLDPMMVCQFEGDQSCDLGAPWSPDDIRFCTGAGTPHASCPGRSPFVDASGIADRGPYQGENMNNDPSTYSIELGARWFPPPAYRR